MGGFHPPRIDHREEGKNRRFMSSGIELTGRRRLFRIPIMYLVSVTRLRLRSWRYFPYFQWLAVFCHLQAKKAPGNRGAIERKTVGWTFWTLTLWESREAALAYRNASPHRDAMPKLLHWCDEASMAYWETESDQLPSWDEAAKQMAERGHLSKVLNPSERQKAGVIATE